MPGWNKPNIPHKGWTCEGIVDLGEIANSEQEIEYEQCEMCGYEKIRYVHIMKHQEYPRQLHVGCNCAENMSDDYVNPRKRENELKNKNNRRKNFERTDWRFNPGKNTYSKVYKGECITIKKGPYGYGIFFANRKIWNYKGKKILSFESAQKVAFEIFDRYH